MDTCLQLLFFTIFLNLVEVFYFKPGYLKILPKIQKDVTFFVCGASGSSALSLRLLESLDKRGVKIKVVYFMPALDFLSEEQRLQERAVRNILQEYARSGLFEDITLVSNKTIEGILGEVSVFDYYNQINKAFCDTYHMIETFKNTKPIMSTFSRLRAVSYTHLTLPTKA